LCIKFLLNLNRQKAPKPENIWFNPVISNKALAKAIRLKIALIRVGRIRFFRPQN